MTKISTHPLITALAKQYAQKIKALKEEQEREIENLYLEFKQKYQCLKQEITEAQEGKATVVDHSIDLPPHRPSC